MSDKFKLMWGNDDADDIIQYDFKFGDGREMEFKVSPSRTSNKMQRETLPEWTLLEFHKCPNCPLDTNKHEHCPAAVDLSAMLELFNDIYSFERVEVTVTSIQRTVYRECDIQTSLQSLIGLVMASSACPVLTRLSSMAVNHLPFASHEETLYRTCSNYLLSQYFKKRNGEEADLELDGLRKLYDDLQSLNQCFVKRFKSSSKKDANMNALVRLFSVAALVKVALDEGLDSLELIFK
jgi:hypothetical protein